ncbi:hypothetical protein SCOCK_70137 [Actinacidiphila cocklensis]|uniref:Uncharacterized protein n=1 Tax=Actinacidiphila cocklensis TaxID=887465 RepID=A0A9W4DXU4_9ACTN|nr:hypothetical protein SCOCK_70137 [Actinacidiphila cocklensis]
MLTDHGGSLRPVIVALAACGNQHLAPGPAAGPGMRARHAEPGRHLTRTRPPGRNARVRKSDSASAEIPTRHPESSSPLPAGKLWNRE